MSTKVFVGNLSFKTRESELAHAFSQAGSIVKNANIITRGPRSLGYGFVEFNTEEDAVKAVTAMNKKSIDGREINVELAKPRVENAQNTTPAQQVVPRTQNPRSFNRGPPQRGGPINNQRGNQGQGRGQVITSPAGNQGQNFNQGFNQGFNRGYGRGRFRRGGGRGRGMYRTRGPPRSNQLNTIPQTNNTSPITSPSQVQTQPEVPRTPSLTTLFVANLPFSVTNEQLTETFKEFNPVKAHVVVKRNQRSKGFGFVEFKNAEDQQKALQAMDKKEVAGRALIVKIALTENKPEEKPAEAAVITTPVAEKKETPASVPVATTKGQN